MRYFSILFFTLFSSCSTPHKMIDPSDRSIIKLYLSTEDYKNKNPSKSSTYTEIVEQTEQYIIIDRIYESLTNLPLKDARNPWAISYKNVIYFNMTYSLDYPGRNLYAKFDIEGKFCALIIDENTSPKITNGKYYGNGLTSIINKEISKTGRDWVDKESKKVRILVFNSTKIDKDSIYGHKVAYAKILTRKNINKLLNLTLSEKIISEMNADEVILLIQKINNKSN